MKNDVVMINLDRPRQLFCGHKAMKMMTKLMGTDIDVMDMNNIDLENIEIVMYCLLLKDARENNETLKLEDMEDLLDYVPFGEVVAKMQEAFDAGMGIFEAEEQSKNLKRVAIEAQQKK